MAGVVPIAANRLATLANDVSYTDMAQFNENSPNSFVTDINR